MSYNTGFTVAFDPQDPRRGELCTRHQHLLQPAAKLHLAAPPVPARSPHHAAGDRCCIAGPFRGKGGMVEPGLSGEDCQILLQ